MNRIIFILPLLFLTCICHANPADSLTHVHFGSSCSPGSYQHENGKHTLTGVGADIWNNYDEFDFAYVKLPGDVQIIARVTSAELIHTWTKAGIMIRQGLYPLSKYAYNFYAPQNLIAFQNRTIDSTNCEDTRITNIQLPYWLKLIRKANIIVSQISSDGINWNTIRAITLQMPDSVYYGLAVTSHVACTNAKAEFDNVSISKNTEPLTPEILNSIIKSKTIYSAHVKDSFLIFINLPTNYNALRTKGYPVVYYLDGNSLGYHYIIRGFMASGLIPEVISVSIGYIGTTQRTRDYTSGFSNFYAFMKNELIPYIDHQFNTDASNRTLFGHSYGGLCALFTLFQDTDYKTFPFQNIIPSSPSIWWPDGIYTYNCEQTLYNQTKILPVNVYMTMGSAETDIMISGYYSMSEILMGRNYKYFNFKNKLNEGQSHGSNSEVSFRDGILWILNQQLPMNTPNSIERDTKTIAIPNPANNVLTINTKSFTNQHITIEIISTSGQPIYNTFSDLPVSKINISAFPKGLYILKITSGKEQFQQKVVFQ